MAVEDFLRTLQESRLQQIPKRSQGVQDFATNFANRRATSPQFGPNYRQAQTQSLAADLVNKSAGNVQTDQYGIAVKDRPNLSDIFNRQAQAITYRGELAAQTTEARKSWQQAKQLQTLNNTFYTTNPVKLPAGAAPDNPGAKAVAAAMAVYKNNVPYVWGGNSLTRGVDCSGLVQQVYKKLGINLPRTTYEQAKSGKIVPISKLMPGDLVFYNTGSADPNGVGKYGHVAMYIGNGKVVEAYNSRKGIIVDGIANNYAPALGVRPW